MPWKSGPDFWQTILGLLAMACATASGAIAKIADDVKNGDRPKFWSRQLWLDLPAVVMMAILAVSTTLYYGLSPGVGAGIGTVLGWVGPRIVDMVIGRRLREWGKGK